MKQYITNGGGCIVTQSVLQGKTPLKWLFREEPVNEIDNGWRAMGRDDTQEYIDQSANHAICDINTLINIEPAVLNVYEMPVGTDLEFVEDATGKYFVDTRTGKEIRERVKSPIQIAFEQNLKFISKAVLETELVKEVFGTNSKIRHFTMENCGFPTGRVIATDPLACLQSPKRTTVLEPRILPGNYPVILAVMDSSVAGRRIVGAKMKITSGAAVKYEPAGALMKKDGQWEKTFAGIPVDAGLVCFCDERAAQGYWQFLDKWYGQNPDGNVYDDYFAGLFAGSYERNPEYQRPEGDFLLWENPEDGTQIAMFASGLGDGFYAPYWGLDEDGKICELVVIFMNPELF